MAKRQARRWKYRVDTTDDPHLTVDEIHGNDSDKLDGMSYRQRQSSDDDGMSSVELEGNDHHAAVLQRVRPEGKSVRGEYEDPMVTVEWRHDDKSNRQDYWTWKTVES